MEQLSEERVQFRRRVGHGDIIVRLIIREWDTFELLGGLWSFDVSRPRIDAMETEERIPGVSTRQTQSQIFSSPPLCSVQEMKGKGEAETTVEGLRQNSLWERNK